MTITRTNRYHALEIRWWRHTIFEVPTPRTNGAIRLECHRIRTTRRDGDDIAEVSWDVELPVVVAPPSHHCAIGA